MTEKTVPLKSFTCCEKTGGKATREVSVYLFVRISMFDNALASVKSSVVALAYDNLRALLKNKQAETHQFLIIFRI